MTVIYADTLFLLNAVVDYLLLLTAARLAGEPLIRLRFALGAGLGGLYSVLIFVPSLTFLGAPLCKASCGVLMLLVAYGKSRKLLRQSVIFLFLTCAFGGGVAAVSLLGGQGMSLGFGIYYSPLDLKMVLLSGAVCYVVLSFAISGIGRHSSLSGELVPVHLSLGNRSLNLTGLVDTGNTLTDPLTGSEAMVAEGRCLMNLFPPEFCPTPQELLDPVAAAARLGRGSWRGRFRLLPYRSVGVSRGLLLAVRMDDIQVSNHSLGAVLVALSPTSVSDGGGYSILVGTGTFDRQLCHDVGKG